MSGAPKKELGQHWLHDEFSLEAMCDAADVSSGDQIVEVGPGLGTLTAYLLDRGATVKAVEFDEVLAADLEYSLETAHPDLDLSRLEIINSDVRKFNFEQQNPGYKVVANIPYYLTSNLIRILCDADNKPAVIAILVQKEVAERVAASDGKMSLLSCIAQLDYSVGLGELVPAYLFTPPPQVDSQILIMTKRNTPAIDGDRVQLIRLFKAGFSGKRKTLLNSLSGGLAISKEEAVELLESAGVNPGLRAEALSLADWQKILNVYR